jgi:hypothetical protein
MQTAKIVQSKALHASRIVTADLIIQESEITDYIAGHKKAVKEVWFETWRNCSGEKYQQKNRMIGRPALIILLPPG